MMNTRTTTLLTSVHPVTLYGQPKLSVGWSRLRKAPLSLYYYDQFSHGPHNHDGCDSGHGKYKSLQLSHPISYQKSVLLSLSKPFFSSTQPFERKHFRYLASSSFRTVHDRDGILTPPDFKAVERDEGGSSGADDRHRAFTYTLIGASGVVGALAAKSSVMNLLSTWSASSEALAFGQVEVDLGAIPVGKSVVLKWRGKPIFIRHRTTEEIREAVSTPMSELRDPQQDSERAKRPEWIVMLGICTHLGCVPIANSGDYNGWYCPCHGSHYDISGRIRKGPAPTNLEIPTYRFLDDSNLLIG